MRCSLRDGPPSRPRQHPPAGRGVGRTDLPAVTTVDPPAAVRLSLGHRLLTVLSLVLVVSCVGLIGCGDQDTPQASEAAPGPGVVEVPAHKVVDATDDQDPWGEFFYYIRLPDVYTEEQMLEIARRHVDVLREKRDSINYVVFSFFFPGTYDSNGPDGVLIWEPDESLGKTADIRDGDYSTFRFRTNILYEGLTAEEGEELLAVPVPGEVVGRWYEHQGAGSIMTIFAHEGKTYFRRQRSADDFLLEEIVEVWHRSGRRFDRTQDSPGRGGYLIVAPDRDLHFFSKRGVRYQIAARVMSEGKWRWPPWQE